MKKITEDLAVPVLSKMTTGTYVEPRLEINKLFMKNICDFIDLDREKGVAMAVTWKGHLDGQAKSIHNDMCFEQYKKHRFTEVGAWYVHSCLETADKSDSFARWIIGIGCWSNDIQLTKEERKSVQYLLEPRPPSFGLTFLRFSLASSFAFALRCRGSITS